LSGQNFFGRILVRAGQAERAVTLLAPALKEAEANPELKERVVAELRLEYGSALLATKSYAEAETQLLAFEQAAPRIHVVSTTTYGRCLTRLVELYTAWNKPEQAALWKQKLETRR